MLNFFSIRATGIYGFYCLQGLTQVNSGDLSCFKKSFGYLMGGGRGNSINRSKPCTQSSSIILLATHTTQCLDLHSFRNLHYRCTILTPRPNGEFPELPNLYAHISATTFYLFREAEINWTKLARAGRQALCYFQALRLWFNYQRGQKIKIHGVKW